MVKGFGCNVRVHLHYMFSYTTLLSLRYGDPVQRTWAAWNFAKENDTSICEAECQIDIGLFLDEYPRWELGTPHRAIILHKMFPACHQLRVEEAEQMVCQGHHGSVYDLSSEADQSAMELVGYHTSQREMRDIYQSIYLLQRAPGLPPCVAPVKEKGNPGHTFFSEGANYIDVDIPPPSETWSPRKNKLGWTNAAPMKKLSGWPTKGLWMLLRLL